jgi:hypothetical protein
MFWLEGFSETSSTTWYQEQERLSTTHTGR